MDPKSLEDVLNLYEEERYEEALTELVRIEQDNGASAPLLVVKGKLLQVAETDCYTLADAKTAFLEALELDKYCLPAILELAWLESSVLGEASDAAMHFNMALALANKFREQALVGLRSCGE